MDYWLINGSPSDGAYLKGVPLESSIMIRDFLGKSILRDVFWLLSLPLAFSG